MLKDLLAEDTICAIATPVGLGGIGIIRISGKESCNIAEQIFLPSQAKFPLKSHRLYHGWIRDPESGELVDEVLLSFMKAPRTYTKEDVVEINCHSGYAVLNTLLKIVLKCGARMADPGEFTYRAFLNGRIDLLQAEAVLELVESKSEKALKLAKNQLKGNYSELVAKWLDSLNNVISLLEASVDFSEDVEDENFSPSVVEQLKSELIDPIADLVKRGSSFQIIKEGVKLALVGKPNVGKSSLLNALLNKERAIVTEYAGTTRDVIEDTFVLDGILIRVVDTAGIRKKADYIEKIGIEKAVESLKEANLILWLIDISVPLTEEDEQIFQIIKDKRFFVVLNKADLTPAFDEGEIERRLKIKEPVIKISAIIRDDVDRLKNFLREHYLRMLVDETSEAIAINDRHRELFTSSLNFLGNAYQMLIENRYPELVLYELYQAKKELEKILGKCEVPSDILDRIFSRFCIGK